MKIRPLDPPYTSQVDGADEETWCQTLREFDDANIYQTWAYAAVISGRRNVSHLIVRRNGDIAAIAQVRIAKVPFFKAGIAYVRWGPLWQRRGIEADAESFRQAVRALHNEFVCKRGFGLRLFPLLFDNGNPCFATILADEGFSSASTETRSRTILMDLRLPIEALRKGMKRNWKRNLKVAEEGGLTITEGSEDEMFREVLTIYEETVARKNFLRPNDVGQMRSIQALLPPELKMHVMLCSSREGVCAGLVWSAIGKTGVELVAATSNAGIASRGSYLLRWKLLEKLKANGFAFYNLNGINPTRNPGGYKFKSEFAGKHGKDVYFLGRFDSHGSVFSHLCLKCGERLRTIYRTSREFPKGARGRKLGLKEAS